MVQVEQIRELKTKYGYTDRKLGEETGYSRQYINQILNGNVAMSPAISARFASLLPRMRAARIAVIKRKTRETDISLELNVDGTGQWEVDTGIKMLDHFLAQVAQHGRFVLKLSFSDNDMAGFATDLIRHFLESFASEGRLNLHARILYGTNDHHKAEALFKALGRALDAATRIDERISGELPSTKG